MGLHFKSWAVWLLTVAAAVPVRAQTAPPQPSSTSATIKVEVRVVLVDVVVTNHKGEAVPNLHQEDFHLSEDGKLQRISAFQEHKRETSTPTEIPALPPNTFTNLQPVKPSDSVNVLLIDMLNTQPWFQKDVCNQAIKYLETVPLGTRLAIFTLNDQQLRLVRGFTADFSGLSVALDGQQSGITPESSWLNPTPRRHEAEMYGLSAMIRMQASPAAVDAVKQYLGQETASLASVRSDLTLQAFQHLARYLSGIPVRKNVIWFADSFPINFAPENKVHTPNHQLHVQQTSDMLTAAQVAIYPVSARGLIGDPTFDIAADTPREVFDEYSNSQIAMETIARETGGRAFYNTNGLDAAMASAVEEGSHYYTLAYSPTNAKNDSKYRRIEVRFPEANYKLSYRRGYYADKPGEHQATEASSGDPLIPLVGFGMPNFDQITYKIQASPVRPQPAPGVPRAGLNTEMPGPFVRFGVDLAISLQGFALETTAEGSKRGRLEAIIVAYNREGKIINITKRTSRFALPPKDYPDLQAKGIPLHLEIDVPRGDIYLRTGIYDLGSGNAGTLGLPLTAASSGTAPN